MLKIKSDKCDDFRTKRRGEPVCSPLSEHTSISITPIKYTEGAWECSLVQISLNGEVVVEVDHGYPRFPYYYFERESKSYMICPTHSYQEFMLLNITDQTYKKISHDDWCAAAFFPNEEYQLLAINGCYWGGPYEYRFYDLRDLDNIRFIKSYYPIEDNSRHIVEEKNERWDGLTFKGDGERLFGLDGKGWDSPPWWEEGPLDPATGWHGVGNPSDLHYIPGTEEYTQEYKDNFFTTFEIKIELD